MISFRGIKLEKRTGNYFVSPFPILRSGQKLPFGGVKNEKKITLVIIYNIIAGNGAIPRKGAMW